MRARTQSVLVMRAKFLDLFQIVGLDRLGVDLDRLMGLVVLEPQHSFKRKQGLRLVEDVKNDEIVPGEPQAMDGLQDRISGRPAGRRRA